MDFLKNNWILVLIFIFALVLRFYDLSKIPNGVQLDEVNVGYQGYQIITTGKNIFGEYLPIYINRFGDYRPAGIFYLTGLSTLIFGLGNFAIRFPVAFISSLSIFLVYFLTYLISKNKVASLSSALLLAISPWHIVASRATSESIVAIFLILLGINFLLLNLQKNKRVYFLISILLLSLSYFFYHTPRLFVPLLLFWFLFFNLESYDKHKIKLVFKKNKNLFFITVFFVFLTISLSFTKFGTGRFSQTSVFSNRDIISRTKVLSDVDQGNILTARIFHNKVVLFTKEVVDQYLSYFSTQFLYIKGGLPNRYVIPDMGLFYYFEAPLLLLGFYVLLRRRDKYSFMILIWLFSAPVAASLTLEDSPNIQRAIFMIPAFQIIEGFGLFYMVKRSYPFKKTLITILLLGLILNLVYFLHQYFVHSPSFISYSRNDGNEKLFSLLKRKEAEYSKIIISNYEDLPIYYFYYNRQTKIPSFSRGKLKNDFNIGKYYFVSDDCPKKKISSVGVIKGEKILIVDSPNCGTEDVVKVGDIVREDSTQAYIINELSVKK